jgi:hypothetical protein
LSAKKPPIFSRAGKSIFIIDATRRKFDMDELYFGNLL